MQDIHHDGFKQINLSDFGQGVEELNLGVLDKLVNLS